MRYQQWETIQPFGKIDAAFQLLLHTNPNTDNLHGDQFVAIHRDNEQPATPGLPTHKKIRGVPGPGDAGETESASGERGVGGGGFELSPGVAGGGVGGRVGVVRVSTVSDLAVALAAVRGVGRRPVVVVAGGVGGLDDAARQVLQRLFAEAVVPVM